jgi:alkylation response protein AidB-like acyl-CoA dehydrogenase
MAGLPLYAVVFKSVRVLGGDVLGRVGGGWAALNSAQMKAAVLQSAMVVGAGERVLEFTADYARTRVQFGEQIGKHQAVQYLVTDISMHAHNADLLALQAAALIAEGRPFLREAAFAKAAASRAAHAITFASHEVHAGIGFMEDYDLHLFTRRGKHWEFNLGDTRWCLEQAVAA